MALVGYGQSGLLSHAYGLQANPEFEIVAVCDLSEDRRRQAESDLGCPSFASHLELIGGVPDLDLACIVTRSDTHCALACDFLRAGIAVVVTKPWVLNVSEADVVLEAQRSGKAQIFPWLPMYWSGEYVKIKQLLDDRAIGDVFMARRQICQFQRRDDWQTESRFGGGYLLNWGPHVVQPLLALVDRPVRSVFGKLQQVINPGDAEDNFHAILEFEGGVVGIAEYAQAMEGLPSFMVQGTLGTIISDGLAIAVLKRDPAGSDPPDRTILPVLGKRFGDEADVYRDIVECLRGRATYRVGIQAAYHGTQVLDAIRESHRTGRQVALDRGEIPPE